MNQIDVVVDVRQSMDTGELIVSKQKLTFSGEARFDGPPVETRVGFVTPKARVSVFGFEETGTGVDLGARVKNVGTVPLEIDRVAFKHRFKEPRDIPSNSGRNDKTTGVETDLLPRHEARKEPLQPGEEREYYLSARMFDYVLLIASSLAPSQFWIAAYCGREEVGRVGGDSIQPFLTWSKITINRRATPIFNTMPDSVRLNVMKAVAPLSRLGSGSMAIPRRASARRTGPHLCRSCG